MPNSIKAVLFDLGGTLASTADVPEIFARILRAHGIEVSRHEISEVHRQNQEEFSEELMAERGPDFWVRWNLRILEGIGVEKDAEFLARKIDELWFDYADLSVYSDVMETLVQLKARKIKIGIVTNGFERDYKKVLQTLGLTGYFDVVVGVDTCNRVKPDKEMFLYAVDKLQVQPAEAIFIGDSVKRDYEGARKAGLKSLLIDREGKAPANVETVRSLTDVLEYV